MATRQSSILAWKIPWKESLVGYSPWYHKELDRTEEFSLSLFTLSSGFPGGSVVKTCACQAGDMGLIPGSGRSPEKGNGNPLQRSCLEIPQTEELGGLQCIGSQS